MEVINAEDGARVRLRKIDPDQVWGWTPESQAAIRESEENYAAGRSTVYESGERFLSALEEWSKEAGESVMEPVNRGEGGELYRNPPYYGTLEWNEGVREARDAVASGETTYYDSDEEFLASFK